MGKEGEEGEGEGDALLHLLWRAVLVERGGKEEGGGDDINREIHREGMECTNSYFILSLAEVYLALMRSLIYHPSFVLDFFLITKILW